MNNWKETVRFCILTILGFLFVLLLSLWLMPIIIEEAEPRDFESSEELQEWIIQDKTNKNLNGLLCGEKALRLISSAEKAGYRLHLDVITWYEYNSFRERFTHHKTVDDQLFISEWPILAEGGAHAVASAIIGDEVWYIEPLADVVWKYGNLAR